MAPATLLFPRFSWSNVAGPILLALPPPPPPQVRCDSPGFARFAILDGLLVAGYLAVPLAWLALLHRHRRAINPSTSDHKYAVYLRSTNAALAPLQFLFEACEFAPSAPGLCLVKRAQLPRRLCFDRL